MIKISVIIPTYNGANKILNLLHTLEIQTFKPFEVIVVIDGSTDNTNEILSTNKFNLSSLKIINQSNKGRAAVRNTGAKAATGDILLFFDDDMIPVKNCIEKHVEHHQKYPYSILTGGTAEDIAKCKTDIQHYKAYLSEKWSLPLKHFVEKPLPKENIFITAANCSIPGILFFELNGFDEQLKDVEDFDLTVKAFQKNIPMYFNYDAFAWHNDFITCKSYIKRQREYNLMLGKLFQSKPFLHSDFSKRWYAKLKGIKFFIMKIFAFKIWIWTIDNFNWLIIIPKKLRYRIYDLIISANGIYFPEKVKL